MTIITLWHCKEPVLLAKNHNQGKTRRVNKSQQSQQSQQSTKALFGVQDFMCLISYIIYIL